MSATQTKAKKRAAFYTAKFGNSTVPVYLRVMPNGTPGYLVANYVDGKRRLVSYKTDQLATDAADTLAKKLSKRDVIGASMTKEDSAAFATATQELQPLGISLIDAAVTIKAAVKIMGELSAIIPALKSYKLKHRDVKDKTVADAITEFRELKEKRGASERYKKDLRLRLDTFAKSFTGNVDNISTDQIQAWLDKGFTGQNYRNFKTVLNTFFGHCVARGYAHDNPVAGVESIRSNGGEIEIFTPLEIARLLAAADKEFRPVLAIGAFAGLRSAELDRVEWSDINFAKRFIEVGKDKSKTRSRRIVAISDNLFAWLQSYSQREGKVWKGTPDGLFDAQQKTAANTAIAADPDKGTKSVAAVEWKANGLRHSFISYRLAETGDAAKTSLEAGNTPAMVFKHYRQIVDDKAAKAWFAVAPEQADNITTLPAAGN
jgi:integrase